MTKTAEIKALRKGMGLTHAGFALAVGCAVQTVRNWERGCAVQPRYRDRLDSVASRQAVATRSTTVPPAGECVNVLFVSDGELFTLFAKGRKPLVAPVDKNLSQQLAVGAWLGAGVSFTITAASVHTGALSTVFG